MSAPSDPAATGPFADVHRRWNPLTGQWVLVSPQRTQRPWQGQRDAVSAVPEVSYDPQCYLCAGNERAGGARNPAYTGTYVFDNDYAALRDGTPVATFDDGLLKAHAESGVCRVICYSPDHGRALGRLPQEAVRAVVDTWAEESRALSARPEIRAVTVFENRGAMMGASNPHPHGQIWANATVPDVLASESQHQSAHHAGTGRCLLCAYAARERTARERVVFENEEFIAVVPFWAVWPFETLLLPCRHASTIDGLDGAARDGLAEALRALVATYDALFGVPFPYTMGWHQRPKDGGPAAAWHVHAHFYPPLLRSATVRKFMVGYEMLAGPQRDITPESAAAQLRALRR